VFDQYIQVQSKEDSTAMVDCCQQIVDHTGFQFDGSPVRRTIVSLVRFEMQSVQPGATSSNLIP
jgi:hypothetical protein